MEDTQLKKVMNEIAGLELRLARSQKQLRRIYNLLNDSGCSDGPTDESRFKRKFADQYAAVERIIAAAGDAFRSSDVYRAMERAIPGYNRAVVKHHLRRSVKTGTLRVVAKGCRGRSTFYETKEPVLEPVEASS